MGKSCECRDKPMINTLKKVVRGALERAGFDVRRNSMLNSNIVLRKRLEASASPVIFDVGANTGQTIKRFKSILPKSEIHAFEPSPTTFEQLRATAAKYPNVHLNNLGVGRRKGSLKLQENIHSDLSSFLPPDKDCWGSIERQTIVPITTIDDYCRETDIRSINLLKTDTQGFDRDVLDGATMMIGAKKIELILTEVTFCKLYEGQPLAPEFIRHILDLGYRLVGLYDYGYRHDAVGWCDALFVNALYQSDDKPSVRSH